MSRFIKFMDTSESDYLQENYPNSFLLLLQIAKNARRTLNGLDGLQVGDAIVGEKETSRKAGLTTKEYRNALIKLEELGYIETVFNPKNEKHQKRAIKRAIKGKVVNLLNSYIFDINPEVEGDQKGDQRAIKGRTEGDKQERTRKNKNEKEQQQQAPVVVVFSSQEKEVPKTRAKENEKILVIYDCLKENKELTEDEKEALMQYPEHRVKLALNFSKTEKPKTTLIQMLVWHCQSKVPPQPSGNRLTEQQKMAGQFNQFLLSIGFELLFEQNKSLIEEGNYINGPFGPLSLKNDTRTLRQDFEDIKSAFRRDKQRRQG